ncbi:MAG: cysteine desulfurase NifS [Firmicutes bacterium]|nr:cysteine desulfurase NifS [Bacillota bacterium]
MQKPFLYFDNAATTPLHPKALDAMMPYFTEQYGNPSGIYSIGRDAKKAINNAREQVAAAIGANPTEIFFTGSGTEANNWAIKGVLEASRAKGSHIITTQIEHHAVIYVCEELEKQAKNGGSPVEVTYLPVDNQGFVSADDLAAAIRPDTVLISIMWANNEIGTIQPIVELAEIAHKNGVIFHTDAVQAVGHIPVSVQDSHINLLTISGHKFGAPKGVGALYIRKGTKIAAMLNGGAQERNRRAGTENVASIVGMGAALQIAMSEQASELARLTAMRETLIERIKKAIPKVTLNGATGDRRLPGNVNFSFDYIEGESILLLLDMNNCCASSGSACSSSSLEPSHVIMALGAPHEQAHSSIRFSLGRLSTYEEIDALMAILPKFIEQLRAMSPLAE